uniref:Uncharacterized protein n=1 Tax=Podoviridae sp. ctZ5d16 TaxID=2825257 RepID=A0A8S5Q9N4_9CAUD|nr:MAG TPA: hypothetical protein [Podoviridae sp. ctZ5d16]
MSGQDYVQLTLFPEGSRASLSPLPGNEEARKMTVSSGRKWLGLSHNSGPLGLLEKMLLESSIWHSTMFYLIWKPRGTKRGHFLFQLMLSAPRTGDTGQQLWPTPKASMKGDCPAERNRRSPDLASAVKMFATPQARDFMTGQASRWEDQEHRSRNLNDQVAMYPTPRSGSMCGGQHAQKSLKVLEKEKKITQEEYQSMSAGNGGQLNPQWVEWLMGFPNGWTDLNV